MERKFLILGRPIYPESRGLLLHIVRSVCARLFRSHWFYLGVRIREFPGRRWVHVEKKAIVLLEIHVVPCDANIIDNNIFLHDRYPVALEVRRCIIPLDGPHSWHNFPHICSWTNSCVGDLRFLEKSSTPLAPTVEKGVCSFRRMGTSVGCQSSRVAHL